MNHKDKVKLARKMQTSEERRPKGQPTGVYHDLFGSAAWEKRKKAIFTRELSKKKV